MNVIPDAMTPAANPAGANPLVILLLAIGWPALFALVAWRVKRALSDGLPDGGTVLGPLLVTVAVAAILALTLSPGIPVLSTYTGLAHIVSAYRIAALEWHWSFPTDYPLAVPVLVAGLVKVVGRTPEAWAAVSLFLALLGCAGTVLLAAAWFRSGAAALVAGLVAATLPPVLLLARADSLSIGYFALSPWVMLFALDRLEDVRAEPISGARDSVVGDRPLRLLAFAGLAVSLFLVVQTRPEAAAFALVPAVLPFFAAFPCARRGWPWVRGLSAALGSMAVPLALALLLLLPYLSTFVGRLGEAGSGNELGFHLVPRLLGGTLALSLLLAVPALVPCVGEWFERRAFLLASVLVLSLCGAGVAVFGLAFIVPGTTVPWFEGGQTLQTVPFWHFNPKVVPLGAIFLAAAGLCSGTGPRDRLLRALLVLWMGGVVTAASAKATGELPFEGLRTQVPASVPFALLAGAGAIPLLRRTTRFLWRLAVPAIALVPFLPACLVPVAGLDYDQQQEYRFLADCLPRLPDRTSLFMPADVVPVTLAGDSFPIPVDLFTLHRSGYLLDSFGDAARGSRVVPLNSLSASMGHMLDGYFFLGLNCYRTGGSTLAPSCTAVLENARLDPVCETRVGNQPYTSDFISGAAMSTDRPRIGIYRVTKEVPDAVP